MASILDPFSGAISANLADIRAAVRTLQTELDDSGLAFVMGPAVSMAGRLSPDVLNALIKSDPLCGDGLGVGASDMVQLRKKIRLMMDDYGLTIAEAVSKETRYILSTHHLGPAHTRTNSIFQDLQILEDRANALISASLRIPGTGKMSSLRATSIKEYEDSKDFITRVAK